MYSLISFSILLISSLFAEQWPLKYPGAYPKEDRQENQDLIFKQNRLSQNGIVKPNADIQTSKNDGYRWIVVPSQKSQQYPQKPMQQYPQHHLEAHQDTSPKSIQENLQHYPQQSPRPENHQDITQESIYNTQQNSPQQPSQISNQHSLPHNQNSLQHIPVASIQPEVNIQNNMEPMTYQQRYENPRPDVRQKVDKHLNKEESQTLNVANVENEPISHPVQQDLPQHQTYRWEQGSVIPQLNEYNIPALYQNPYISNPQTVVQEPFHVQHAPVSMVNPSSSVNLSPLSNSVSNQMIPQSYVQEVILQPSIPSLPILNDEYSRMDLPSGNDIDGSYCADYNPETKHQVLYKDPNSKVHFLTCIGRNQIRRMVCPRYTVFNEYSRRCVSRQNANDKCGPCENGGQCVQDQIQGTYRCQCPVNFRGESCELFEDPCKRHPCGTTGLCFNISSSPGHICQCTDHVFNDNCNENVINNCHQLGMKRFYAERGNLFVHCTEDGLAFVKKCPLGMVFNDAKETCTFPPSYTREFMVHPPGSFRSDIQPVQQDRSNVRDKRSAIWAW